MELTIGDLFSGIGGFSKAFEDVNPQVFKTKFFCERDKHAQKVLQKHWPITPIFEDISTLNGKLVKVDILCGGFSLPGYFGGRKTIRNEKRSCIFRSVRSRILRGTSR